MANPKCFEDAIREVVRELTELLIRKQRDYGPENIIEFGEFGVLVRANDKMARLKNLLKSGTVPLNESVEDSWRDLANYAIIALMMRRGWFILPLKERRMSKIISYQHHGAIVFVDEDLKGKHREHCLCFRCAAFKPDIPENCDLAEQNYRACKINDMVMPVYECAAFVEKEDKAASAADNAD